MAYKRRKNTPKKKKNFATSAFEDSMMAFPELVGAKK